MWRGPRDALSPRAAVPTAGAARAGKPAASAPQRRARAGRSLTVQSLGALGPFEEEALPLLLLGNNEAVFLFSEAVWLSTLYSVRKYALIYFLSRISKLTAQRHRSVVSFGPLTSPGPTLLSLSATPSPAPGPPALSPVYHLFGALTVYSTQHFVRMYPFNSYSSPRR